jgi:hypothetical protein
VNQLARIIPLRTPLEDDNLVTLARVFQPQLVFEIRRASLVAELPDGPFDPLEFEVTERITH